MTKPMTTLEIKSIANKAKEAKDLETLYAMLYLARQIDSEHGRQLVIRIAYYAETVLQHLLHAEYLKGLKGGRGE